MHAQPSLPLLALASFGQRLSPASKITFQSPQTRTDVLGNSHPLRSIPQPMADGNWYIHTHLHHPSGGITEARGTQQTLSPAAYSGNLINKAHFLGRVPFLPHSLLPASDQPQTNYFCWSPCLGACFGGNQDKHLLHEKHYPRPYYYYLHFIDEQTEAQRISFAHTASI